jgi:hypothetical protein
VKDILWLGGQISALSPFASGSAVVCGSVAWGTPSARSDIDIAHFGTRKHPQIESVVEGVLARYRKRTKDRFIAPRVDIITIGVESAVRAAKTSSHSITKGPVTPGGVSVGGVSVRKRNSPAVFADTFVRFVDHIGSLAHSKVGPWEEFMKRHLSPQRENYRDIQREGIRSYVAATTKAWDDQPLHQLNLGANHEFTQRQLSLAGQAENYPVNLMRRILGEMQLYPRPDRAADVRKRFEELNEPWAKRLIASSAPFFALGPKYEAIIAETRKSSNGLTASEYQERCSALFDALPFDDIQEAVWDYLNRS